MAKSTRSGTAEKSDPLFDRIVTILEEARGNVVRAVNTGMVTAYWLIGRVIVEALQDGAERAEYGKQVVEKLSARLTERYGKGFSEQSLQNFRRFYLFYSERVTIPSPMGRESNTTAISSLSGRESGRKGIRRVANRLLKEISTYQVENPRQRRNRARRAWNPVRTRKFSPRREEN